MPMDAADAVVVEVIDKLNKEEKSVRLPKESQTVMRRIPTNLL